MIYIHTKLKYVEMGLEIDLLMLYNKYLYIVYQ